MHPVCMDLGVPGASLFFVGLRGCAVTCNFCAVSSCCRVHSGAVVPAYGPCNPGTLDGTQMKWIMHFICEPCSAPGLQQILLASDAAGRGVRSRMCWSCYS